MIKIYHNPRCSKSRQALALVEASGHKFEVVEYLKTGVTKKELEEIVRILKNPIHELIRTKESEFDKNTNIENKNEVIKAIVNCPKLLERPLVIKGKKAIIGRPPEAVETIL